MVDYHKWIDKANDDLRWTQSNIHGEVWYGACFTAQQAAEKGFKGFLLFHKKPLRKIHDLIALIDDCIKINGEFEQIKEDAKQLYPYYMETRYPGFDDFGSFTKQNAEEAYEAAKKIITFIQERIRNK